MKSTGKKNSAKKIPSDHVSGRSMAQVDKVRRLFQDWLQDSSGYDEQTWPQLKQALNENHSKLHKLFDE